MINQSIDYYLMRGLSVGQISKELGKSKAAVRLELKYGGVTIRTCPSGRIPGRDSVCGAVRRAGFSSFHEFARTNSLNPISTQAKLLNVSPRALSRVYSSYRKLITNKHTAAVGDELGQQ